MLYKSKQQNKGFTLIETLVGVAVFVVISTSIYQAYVSLFNFISLNQYKIVALNLVNEQFEIIRNLSYSNVGIPGSIPSGTIPQTQNINRSGIDFVVRTTIRNIDQPYDGTIGGNPNDLSPADNKLVEVEVSCAACINFLPLTLTTTIAPKNLETASTNGALQVKVFDANGVPVSGANVSIRNYQGTTTISIDDVTNSSGVLQIVDVPPGIEAYEIYVSKAGYSSDRTYPNGAVSNPTPSKPHATVIVQQLTQISFSIDRLSSITFNSVTDNCVAIPDVDFSLKGAKQIGSSVYKFNKNLATDNSGIYSSTTMEWDYYTVTGIDSAYDIIGINPLNPISLNPNVNQNVLLIVTPKDPRTLLVTVKDNSTLLPLTDATVRLRKGVSFDKTEITGRGSINQTDWSGGVYSFNDGNIEVADPIGDLKLLNVFGSYNPSGIIESTTIDTGSVSNFYNLSWLPVDQPVVAGTNSVRLQFATNSVITGTTTWDYKGPDGTSSTYYTIPNSPISSIHNGDRYARYKIFLNTISATNTPIISDVSFTVTSSCTPPGQVIFSDLDSGTYTLDVTKNGYNSFNQNIDINSNWFEQEVILSQ
jgi:prepilin-type N-terminal cleavage/methylation domain-containing protein